MDELFQYVKSRERDLIALIREMVECESPSDDPAAVNRFADLVADSVSGLASVRTLPGGRFGKILVCEMNLPGRRKSGPSANRTTR